MTMMAATEIDMPEINDDGNPEKSVTSDNEDFAWAEEEEPEGEAEEEFDTELMEEAESALGLTESEATDLGEDRVRELVDRYRAKVSTRVETHEGTAAKTTKRTSTHVRDVDLDEEFDERLVAELKHDRAMLKDIQGRLDRITSAHETAEMDTLRDVMKETAKSYPKLSGAMKREAQNVVTALKAGFPDGEMPSDQELVDMALRSVGGKSPRGDRSSQFMARPTHRKEKEPKTAGDRRDKAIRNVKAFMDDAGMLD